MTKPADRKSWYHLSLTATQVASGEVGQRRDAFMEAFAAARGPRARRRSGRIQCYHPRQRSKRAVLRFPLEVVNEATGSDVRDDEGNLYFAARRNDAAAAQVEESGASRPVLIIFNPEKELR